jgi:hypothetical protein
MHKDWTTAAKKAGIAAKQISDILQALGMDFDHPSPKQVKVFQTACELIKAGKTIPEAVDQMISAAEQEGRLQKDHPMLSQDTIREHYPQLSDDHIHQSLELLGVGPDVAEIPVAKMEEFEQLQEFIEAGRLESWDDIRAHWQSVHSEQPQAGSPSVEPPSKAITVSQSGVMAVPSSIPAEIRESLAAPILESVDAYIEEVPGKMAQYQQKAQDDIDGGLENFVQGTFYQGVNKKLQSPKFVSTFREALQSGKSRPSSES